MREREREQGMIKKQNIVLFHIIFQNLSALEIFLKSKTSYDFFVFTRVSQKSFSIFW